MSVSVHLHGSIGDRMFQYAFARLFAERHGLGMKCDGASRSWTRYLPDVALAISGRWIDDDGAAIRLGGAPAGDRHLVDLCQYQTVRTPVVIDGYFQRYEYFAESRALAKVKTWFDGFRALAGSPMRGVDAAVYVTATPAFAVRGWILPLDYYTRALERLNVRGTVCVCIEAVTDHVRHAFERWDAVYVTGDIGRLIGAMAQAEKIVIPNSTTAWWAAILAAKKTVVAPVSSRGAGYAFRGYDSVDLWPSESGWIAEDVATFARTRCTVRSWLKGGTLMTAGPELAVCWPTSGTTLLRDEPGLQSVIGKLCTNELVRLDDLGSSGRASAVLTACRSGFCTIVTDFDSEL